MIFIETSFFTEDVKQLLSDEEYGKLQEYLAANPRHYFASSTKDGIDNGH